MNAASPSARQPRTLDDLAELTTRTRAEAEATREALLASLGELWTSGANTVVDELVARRPTVVNAMDTAEISVLKFNLAHAIEDGRASIPSIFKTVLDIDILAKAARANTTGGISVSMADQVATLSRPLFGLLDKAGLRPDDIKRGSSVTYGAFSGWDLGMAHKPAENTFTTAVERYGKAKLAHDTAVRQAASQQATKRWADVEPSAG